MQKKQIHTSISKESTRLHEFYGSSSLKNWVEISSFVAAMSFVMKTIRADVDSMLVTQKILLEAHEVIGTASLVLTSNEVDKFHDLDQLELLYSQRCNAWQLMNDCHVIRRQLLASKLSKNNIAGIARRHSTYTMSDYDVM